MLDNLTVTPNLLKQAHALLKSRTGEKRAFTPMDAGGPGAGGPPPGDPSQGGGAPPPGGPGGPGSPPPPGGDPAAQAGGAPVTADMLQQMLPGMIQQIMMQMGGGMPGQAGGGGKGGGKADQMATISHDIAEIKNQVNQLFAFLTGMQMQNPDGEGGGPPAGLGGGVDPSQGPGDAPTMPADPAGGGGAPPPPPAPAGGGGMQVQASLQTKESMVKRGKLMAETIARLQKKN